VCFSGLQFRLLQAGHRHFFLFLADGLINLFKLFYSEALAETDHQ